MFEIIAIGIALIGSFAAGLEGYKAWGSFALAIIPLGIVLALFVPYGAYVAAVGTIVFFQRARTAHMDKIANPTVDDDVADIFD